MRTCLQAEHDAGTSVLVSEGSAGLDSSVKEKTDPIFKSSCKNQNRRRCAGGVLFK